MEFQTLSARTNVDCSYLLLWCGEGTFRNELEYINKINSNATIEMNFVLFWALMIKPEQFTQFFLQKYSNFTKGLFLQQKDEKLLFDSMKSYHIFVNNQWRIQTMWTVMRAVLSSSKKKQFGIVGKYHSTQYYIHFIYTLWTQSVNHSKMWSYYNCLLSIGWWSHEMKTNKVPA